MDKFMIFAEYPSGVESEAMECDTLEEAEKMVAMLESLEENYNVIFTIR